MYNYFLTIGLTIQATSRLHRPNTLAYPPPLHPSPRSTRPKVQDNDHPSRPGAVLRHP